MFMQIVSFDLVFTSRYCKWSSVVVVPRFPYYHANMESATLLPEDESERLKVLGLWLYRLLQPSRGKQGL